MFYYIAIVDRLENLKPPNFCGEKSKELENISTRDTAIILHLLLYRNKMLAKW